jgi:hypothetical protein
MAGGYGDGYRVVGPSGGGPAVTRLVAAGLLVVMAALAVGGSFGALWEYVVSARDDGDLVRTYSVNGWRYVMDDPVQSISVTQHGISLTIGALLAVAAAIMLIVTARQPADPAAPRLAGVGSAAFLLASIGAVWLELAAQRGAAANVDAAIGDIAETDSSIVVGIGAWLLLLAAVAALAVVGLLLTPRRAAPTGGLQSGAGHVAPYHFNYGAPPTYPPGTGGAPGAPPVGGPPGRTPPNAPRI